MKQLIKRLEKQLYHASKAERESKYEHVRWRASGKRIVIEDVLSELRYEEKRCKSI